MASIEGTGSICITVKGQKATTWIELQEVAYRPGFHVNLVSYINLKAKGTRWIDVTDWLILEKDKFIEISHQAQWPIN
jgi:hypothetical protein